MSRLVVRLKSDNFDHFVSFRYYQRVRMEMSSGDFATHTHEICELPLNETFIGVIECVSVADDGTDFPDEIVGPIAMDLSIADVVGVDNLPWFVDSTEGV